MELKRNFSRAPLVQAVLFESSEFVFTATSLNISASGIFLGNLAFVPDESTINIMINIPQIPSFKKMLTNEELAQRLHFFDVKTLSVKIQIMRDTINSLDVDSILSRGVGCKFLNLSNENFNIINNYVKQSQKNIKFLLSLFEEAMEENLGDVEESHKTLLYLAQILDHDKNTKPSLIRSKLLSDYQSFF